MFVAPFGPRSFPDAGMAPVFAAAASSARLLLTALVLLAAQECSVAPANGFRVPCVPGSNGAQDGEDRGRASGGRAWILDSAPCGLLPGSQQVPTSPAVHFCGQRFVTEIEGGARRSFLRSMRGGDSSAEIAHRPKSVKRTKPAEDGKVVKRKKTGESKKAVSKATTSSGDHARASKPPKRADPAGKGETVKRKKSGDSKKSVSKADTASGEHARAPKPPKRANPEEGKAVKREKTGKGKSVKRDKTGESSISKSATKARPSHAAKSLSKAEPTAGATVKTKDGERAERECAPRLTGTPFEELEPKLNSTILEALASMGFTSTAPVQLATIPLLL